MSTMLAMWPGPIKQIFVPSTQEGSTLSLVTVGPVATEEMRVKSQRMTSTSCTHIISYIHEDNLIN